MNREILLRPFRGVTLKLGVSGDVYKYFHILTNDLLEEVPETAIHNLFSNFMVL